MAVAQTQASDGHLSSRGAHTVQHVRVQNFDGTGLVEDVCEQGTPEGTAGGPDRHREASTGAEHPTQLAHGGAVIADVLGGVITGC